MQEYLIYLRKSRQDNPNETIEEVLARHEKQLQEYAIKTFGYRIDEENIYREIVSGETIEDRPQINLIFERIQSADIKGVLVIEPQRLTRGDMLDCGTVVHLFRYTNTLIVTPQKTYSLEDKYDRKFFEMELSRGNDYLEYTKEILGRGRIASIKEGNYIGGSRPYGYNKIRVNKKPTLEINEEEAQYVRLMFQWRNEGMGLTTIARKLDEMGAKPCKREHFDQGAIKTMLKSEVYIGKIRHRTMVIERTYVDGKMAKKKKRNPQYELFEGNHQPIISEELFYEVQRKHTQDSRTKKDLELVNPFASLIKCKKCGSAISLKRYMIKGVEQKQSRYKCRNSFYCDNVSCTEKAMTTAILDALKAYLKDFEVKVNNNNDEVIKSHADVLNTLKKELDKLEKKQEELYTFLEDGIYTKEVFLKRNEKLATERTKLEEAIKNAEKYVPTVTEYKEKYTSLYETLEALENPNVSASIKNRFLKSIISVIWYERTGKDIKIEIELK